MPCLCSFDLNLLFKGLFLCSTGASNDTNINEKIKDKAKTVVQAITGMCFITIEKNMSTTANKQIHLR